MDTRILEAESDFTAVNKGGCKDFVAETLIMDKALVVGKSGKVVMFIYKVQVKFSF